MNLVTEFASLAIILGVVTAVSKGPNYEDFVKKLAKNETFNQLFTQHIKLFQDSKGNTKEQSAFACNPFPSLEDAISVHKLTPADVKVVAALGDSITAGSGITASTVLGLLREDRGLSWSIGGEKSIENYTTLPNILRVYNSNVTGYATGSGPVWKENVAHLDVAHPGDKSEDLPGQAKKLIERLTQSDKINYLQDWKVITIFIGANDLCDYCLDKEAYSAEAYIKNVQTTLDILHRTVPRVFVNLVPVLNVSIVKALNANLVCKSLHYYFCSCAAFPYNSQAEKEVQAETEKYQKLTYELVDSGRYDTRDDFTVVIQPFITQALLPKTTDGGPDLRFFAPDCFHFSLRGHQAAALALWNNMVEPVGQKKTRWTPHEPVECPSQRQPYFFTKKNSYKRNNLIGQKSGINSQSDEEFHAKQTGSYHQQQNKTGSPVWIVVGAVFAFVSVILTAYILISWRKRQNIISKSSGGYSYGTMDL